MITVQERKLLDEKERQFDEITTQELYDLNLTANDIVSLVSSGKLVQISPEKYVFKEKIENKRRIKKLSEAIESNPEEAWKILDYFFLHVKNSEEKKEYLFIAYLLSYIHGIPKQYKSLIESITLDRITIDPELSHKDKKTEEINNDIKSLSLVHYFSFAKLKLIRNIPHRKYDMLYHKIIKKLLTLASDRNNIYKDTLFSLVKKESYKEALLFLSGVKIKYPYSKTEETIEQLLKGIIATLNGEETDLLQHIETIPYNKKKVTTLSLLIEKGLQIRTRQKNALDVFLESNNLQKYKFLIIALAQLDNLDHPEVKRMSLVLKQMRENTFQFQIEDYLEDFHISLHHGEIKKAMLYLNILESAHALGFAIDIEELKKQLKYAKLEIQIDTLLSQKYESLIWADSSVKINAPIETTREKILEMLTVYPNLDAQITDETIVVKSRKK